METNRIALKWSPPTEANGIIKEYLITWIDDEQSDWNGTVPSNASEDILEDGILACTSYNVSLSAINSFGPGVPDLQMTRTGEEG